jgi:hypothetical protein
MKMSTPVTQFLSEYRQNDELQEVNLVSILVMVEVMHTSMTIVMDVC